MKALSRWLIVHAQSGIFTTRTPVLTIGQRMNTHDGPIPVIEMEKVILRPLRYADAGDIYEAYSDAGAMKFRRNPPLTSLDDARRMVDEAARLAAEKKSLRWGIEERSSGRVIGTFLWIVVHGTDISEIGYSLNKRWWNKGLMTGIASSMIEYLFRTHDVRTLIAKVHEENLASIRLLTRLGFTERERKDGTMLIYGKESPHHPPVHSG